MGSNILGIYSKQPFGAGGSDAKNRPNYFARASGVTQALGRSFLTVIFILIAPMVLADTVRVATFNVSMGRRGPGVLLKGLMSGKDKQIAAVVDIIQHMHPDILLLNEFDNDATNLALLAFIEILAEGADGVAYQYFYAPFGNEGQPSGLDLDGDGKPFEWADALGFGRFAGSEGMVLLSRFPLDVEAARSFSKLSREGVPSMSAQVRAALRLSSKSHWDVPVTLPNGERLHILASHPGPPVFDGVEDINGLRNNAEIAFWVDYLDGLSVQDDAGVTAPFNARGFVLLGDLNNDPADGEGHKPALHALLNHRRISDPRPMSEGAVAAALRIGGANGSQLGDAAQDTVEWDSDIGNMRVDYALPSAGVRVVGTGVFWPPLGAENGNMIAEGRNGASNHRLVWVDLDGY